jgi:hypothetical protein
MQVPLGIGPVLAAGIVAEIGDATRFFSPFCPSEPDPWHRGSDTGTLPAGRGPPDERR